MTRFFFAEAESLCLKRRRPRSAMPAWRQYRRRFRSACNTRTALHPCSVVRDRPSASELPQIEQKDRASRWGHSPSLGFLDRDLRGNACTTRSGCVRALMAESPSQNSSYRWYIVTTVTVPSQRRPYLRRRLAISFSSQRRSEAACVRLISPCMSACPIRLKHRPNG